MKTILISLSILFFSIISFECRHKKVQKGNRIKKVASVEDEYHKEMILSKGDSTFFIPKHEIGWYFNNKNFLSIDSAAVGDNVSFFDSLGNIVYQALVVEVKRNKTIIRCIDLKTTNSYETELVIDSIRDLKKGYHYKVKIYKSGIDQK